LKADVIGDHSEGRSCATPVIVTPLNRRNLAHGKSLTERISPRRREAEQQVVWPKSADWPQISRVFFTANGWS
jgi:hypothetical protein